MTTPNADAFRNVTKYTGINYQFAPQYTRSRDPTSADLRDPKNQGYYPYNSIWNNKTNGNIWILQKIVANKATWIMFTGSSGSVVNLVVDTFSGTATTATVSPDGSGNITINGAVVNAGTNPVRTDSTAPHQFNIELQKSQAIASADATKIGLSAFKSTEFNVDANGFVSLVGGTGPVLQTLSDDVGTKALPDGTGNIQLVGHVVEQGATKFSTIVKGTNLLNINPMSSTRWIVDPLGFNGTHTTIASAITSATSGDIITLLSGVFTENITMKGGVSIFSNGNSTILGTVSASYSGEASIENVTLQTNGATAISITGSNSCQLDIINCPLVASGQTLITINNINAIANISYCGNIGLFSTAKLFAATNLARLQFDYCHIATDGTDTNSTATTGIVRFDNCYTESPFTNSGSNSLQVYNSGFNAIVDQTMLTVGNSSNSSYIFNSVVQSINSICVVNNCLNLQMAGNTFITSNAVAISGSGQLTYAGLSFQGTGAQAITCTTINPEIFDGGKYRSSNVGVAPAASFIGERLSNIFSVGLANTVNTNLTSINLTPGIWDVSACSICTYTGTPTAFQLGISQTSATFAGNNGDQFMQINTTEVQTCVSIPAFRFVVTVTASYFAVGLSQFTGGASTATGRISAVRVA